MTHESIDTAAHGHRCPEWRLNDDGSVESVHGNADVKTSRHCVVRVDESGRFAGVKRQYRDVASHESSAVFVTRDPTLVRRWANDDTRRTVTPFVRGRSWSRHAEGHAARSPRGKRVFDIVLSILGLVLTAPCIPFIMLAIWIEDGRPFFYIHRRQTLGGREFGCIKFRTMSRDADTRLSDLASQDLSDGPQFNIQNDPRLLRSGPLLRRWCLDEIPQLLNILRGEMSFVGPRPSPSSENQYVRPWRYARTSVRPGLTGLWQICRRREPLLDFQEWIRYDMLYVNRQSWRLDLWILWMTLVVTIRDTPARYD